jgi:hypothetical protein
MRGTTLLLIAVAALAFGAQGATAQRSYSERQPLYPAYEGWVQEADGSIKMVFGYMNQNWEQLLDVPVGENNYFSPGPADRGQPTHFLPRRNRFTFMVPVPEGFGEDDELVWTVKANGREEKAYGTLREDLFIDNVVIMSETGALGAGTSSPEIRANIPPQVELEGPTERTVTAGEKLTLAAVVTDDGQPNRASLRRAGVQTNDDDSDEEEAPPTPRELLAQALRARTANGTVGKRVALHFTWFVYRTPEHEPWVDASVDFDPPQIKPWEDTRPFANSPWAVSWKRPEQPEDHRWVSEVTFKEPGTYVLHGRADDGGLYTDVEVTVQVEPSKTVF